MPLHQFISLITTISTMRIRILKHPCPEKVKSDSLDRFQAKIAIRHFFMHPVQHTVYCTSTYLKLHLFTKIYLNLPWFISIYHKLISIYINLPQITLICLTLHQFTSIYSMPLKVMAGSCFQSILEMYLFPSCSSLYQSSGLTR